MNYQGAFSLGTPDSQSSKILAFSQTQQDIPHTIFPEVPKFSDEFSRNCFADIFDHDISVRQDLKHVDHSGSSIAKQIGVTEDLINEDLDLAIEMTLKNPSFKELVVKLEKKLEDSVFK
ncbi:unnamed protein product [Kuraishia capsulata CBS 1993]|uniref:Uncharacterized protein n=1 Tax=Kuraishia capsulata CBS 1993 TaxID=1382522 RepID=W6MXD5_9ASCO|nr:uncharacterized protein KUCA_T00004684001 [Kuraishia capsulata CBS 1993]CDK28700.1 unnamed protein product [Kuraishia capsulata CBS 1993]